MRILDTWMTPTRLVEYSSGDLFEDGLNSVYLISDIATWSLVTIRPDKLVSISNDYNEKQAYEKVKNLKLKKKFSLDDYEAMSTKTHFPIAVMSITKSDKIVITSIGAFHYMFSMEVVTLEEVFKEKMKCYRPSDTKWQKRYIDFVGKENVDKLIISACSLSDISKIYL